MYVCVCLGRMGVLGLWFATSQIWMFVRTFWSNHGTFMECIKFNDDMINISHTPHADEHVETHFMQGTDTIHTQLLESQTL